MSGNRRGLESDLGSDLVRVDADAPGPCDYAEIPELSDDWFDRAQSNLGGRPRGRPKSESPKQSVNLRLSQRVLSRFRESGPGWQTRINAVLEQWLDRNP